MYRYYTNCVNWPEHDVPALTKMIEDNTKIIRQTFLRHTNSEDRRFLEAALGYALHHTGGLTMAADRHVTYHRSYLHGKLVHYFRHSAIEYVFTRQ